MNTNESTVSTGATYTTQMDAARKGIITPEMKIVAQKEKMTEEELRELVACGKVVIPANKNHKSLNPEGVGSMLRTKINVNLGVSRDCKDYDVEMEKVMAALTWNFRRSMTRLPWAQNLSWIYRVMEIHNHSVKS